MKKNPFLDEVKIIVIGIITVITIMLITNSSCCENKKSSDVYDRDLSGIVKKIGPGYKGVTTLKITRKNNYKTSHEVLLLRFDWEFVDFVRVGDSLKSDPGDKKILLFRDDIVYEFAKYFKDTLSNLKE
jgi:hypothetical protein